MLDMVGKLAFSCTSHNVEPDCGLLIISVASLDGVDLDIVNKKFWSLNKNFKVSKYQTIMKISNVLVVEV